VVALEWPPIDGSLFETPPLQVHVVVVREERVEVAEEVVELVDECEVVVVEVVEVVALL
jgi:hypothetical protein